MTLPKIDPKLDLVFERVVDVPRELVWKAWTTPEYLKQWFTPLPWTTVDCKIDLRPGGIFQTTMRSPEGQDFPNVGCYLELVENEKLVWTSALLPGFRPAPAFSKPGPQVGHFTAVLLFEPHEKGSKYTAIAMHSGEEGRKAHEALGFIHGWGLALDQLVALAKRM